MNHVQMQQIDLLAERFFDGELFGTTPREKPTLTADEQHVADALQSGIKKKSDGSYQAEICVA